MSLIDTIRPLSTVLSSAVDKSLQHQEKLGNAENQTRDRWVQSKMATYLLRYTASYPFSIVAITMALTIKYYDLKKYLYNFSEY